jgi:hypothetical protein
MLYFTKQVCRPSWIWATSLFYIILNKIVALVGTGRRTCRPSRDEKGLKDWAIDYCRSMSCGVLGHATDQPFVM